MRPTELTMTAFGPYRETETIDFAKLKDHGLFAVSGATGAGKTTIFDAICFALYGQASGEDRTDIRALRSDFARNDLQTAVELEFAIQGRLFRVFRQVPYTKKGNKSETGGRVEFFEVTPAGEVPAVDRQIVTEVNRKIEELIGFTLAQFSQIVMLPQGEFRKFLTSDTENKETILRKIFKTEHYRELTDSLKRKKDALFSELSAARFAAEQLTAQLAGSLPERESALSAELNGESIHYGRLAESLKEEAAHYGSEAQRYDSIYKTEYAAHGKAQQAFAEAAGLNRQFDDLTARKETLRQLLTKEDDMEKGRLQLQKAEQAVLLDSLEQRAAETARDADRRQEEYRQAERKLAAAKIEAAAADERWQQEQLKNPEREEAANRILTLQSYVPRVTEIEEGEQRISRLSAQAADGQEQTEQLQAQLLTAAEKISTLQDHLKELEESAEGYEELLETLGEAREKNRLITQYLKLAKKEGALTDERTAAEEQLHVKKEHLQHAESIWLSDQAALVAAALEDGAPCPVCGSLHHPAVRTADAEGDVTREQLERLRQETAKAAEQFQSADLRLQHVRSEMADLEQQLGSGPDDSTAAVSGQQVAVLAARLDQMKESRIRLKRMKEQFGQEQEALTALQGTLAETEKRTAALTAELKEAKSVLEATVRDVPGCFRSLDVLKKEIRIAEKLKGKLMQASEKAQAERQSTAEKLLRSKAAREFTQQASEEALAGKQQAAQRFAESLSTSVFTDEADYMGSKRSEEERAKLAASIQDYEIACRTAGRSIAELEDRLAGKQRADTEQLEEQVRLHKQRYEHAYENSREAHRLERTASEGADRLLALLEEQGGLDHRHGKVAELYDLVRGNNERKLSFERYLQTEYLERILQAANGRLTGLSNGQFQLQRSDRQESRGRQSGLGIDVYDEYTGQNRDVKTLSGGEKFNASLSLALGMADVIQSFQGSISIETMFIDEGFGSLDEESLQKAVDTLIGLQRDGRMIGVISHVAELKEAFPAILRVEKTKEGDSYTEIVIQ
ncbi:nuclease SbcCD subunit C [Sporosarcina sp. NCCP-2716]|uniref:AAA family ATPase n=1 Tax=Sporosarcina sp. NCCP-2716 TaxID=2943679 RepID=UPI00203F76BE|nr:SMC family ATPase [Sporosarcina sp. NCCP-2716]GKV69515.1 nuclease SbcCD subunit C [Sporosarcina sp. NCCP-2716]